MSLKIIVIGAIILASNVLGLVFVDNARADYSEGTGAPTTALSFAQPAGLTDLEGHTYESSIRLISALEIIEGYSDGTFRPDGDVGRVHFVKMIVYAFNLPIIGNEIAPFSDLGIDDPSHNYPHQVVAVAAEKGIVLGKSPGRFAPYDTVNLAQLMTIIVRTADTIKPGLLVDPPVGFKGRYGNFSDAHQENMVIAEANGLLNGLITVNSPWQELRRGEVAHVISNVIDVIDAHVVYEAPEQDSEFDAVVFGNTSATAAFTELMWRNSHGKTLKVAVLNQNKSGRTESPIGNGLGLEDNYGGREAVSGPYLWFRDQVISSGAGFELNQRLRVAPDKATQILNAFTKKPNVTMFNDVVLLSATASAEAKGRTVTFRASGQEYRLQADVLVDASPEARLARMLGASYKIGQDEGVYNDKSGRIPARPSVRNSWITSPQALSVLLTLYDNPVGGRKISELGVSYYTEDSFDPGRFVGYDASKFGSSWSWSIAALGGGLCELNERETDFQNADAAYDWVLSQDPLKREGVRQNAAVWALNFVRYLQENGWQNIDVVSELQTIWPYVRGGVRVLGVDTLTHDDIANRILRDVIGSGTYALYDWHHPVFGPEAYSSARIRTPYGSMVSKEIRGLLVPVANSADFQASASADRMENLRMAKGGACAAAVILADKQGVDIQDVAYWDVRRDLLRLGYSLN